MQFDRDAEGNLTPLPRPSIDTGMGLERVATVLQGKLSNFETDLIRPIIDQAAETMGSGIAYGTDPKTDTTLRIIADHSRAATFLVHDGVIPANEGRGYVLRKIIRRALRHARLAGCDKPFLYELTGFVAELMKPGYPEVLDSVQRIARIVKEEEVRYQHSFALAERMFEEAVAKLSDGDEQGAMGAIEGAVGDLEAVVESGLLDAGLGATLLDSLVGTARRIAEEAIAEAIARGGDSDKISEAEQALADGDALRAAGAFKDAAAAYKDAVAIAEGA